MSNLVPPMPPPDETLVHQPEFKRGRRYTDEDMRPIIEGAVILPNREPMTLDAAVSAAGTYYGHVHQGRARVDRHFPGQALFFLECGQGGGLTGEGMVMRGGGWKDGAYIGIAERFAICKHESVEDPGANHSRGWHPAHCKKCGLDLSVDSGD